jgi:hypothetical protein
MTVRLCATVGFYQDGIAGKRLLKNLTDLGIPSIWGDGRVYGFTAIDSSNFSTDGFREVIQNTPNATLIDIGLQFPGQGTQKLFHTAAKMGYNYVINLGCDEYLEGDVDLFIENLGRIPLKEPTRMKIPIVEHNPEHNNNAKHVQSRVVYMPQYVEIKNIHWIYYHNFYGDDRPVIMGVEKNDPLVLGLTLHHDDTIRPDWRNTVMDIFQKEQVKRERAELKDMITAELTAEYDKKFRESDNVS